MTIGIVVFCKRRAQRARDMAGFRIDRFRFTAVSLAGACIDERHAAQQPHVVKVEHGTTGRLLSAKRTALCAWRVCRQRRAPGLEPTVEYRPRAVAKVAEQKPQPRRHRAAAVVVDDNLCLGAQAGIWHRFLELGGRGQRMATSSSLFSRDVLEVHEHRARDMAANVLVATVPTLQVPAKAEPRYVVVVDVLVQPARVDQRTETLHLGMDHPRVVTEMHRVGPHRLDLDERALPVTAVGVLSRPLGEISLLHVAIDVGRVRRVTDHHRNPVGRVNEYALWPTVWPGVSTTRTPS